MPEHPFGAALRQARADRGVSLATLARLVHYSKGYLSRVERGERLPSPALARSCDEVLGAGGAIAALVTDQPRARQGSHGASRPRPAQLPPAVAGFTGRAAELGELAVALDDGRTAVIISAIGGMAGVGKTALAVHFAHRVANQFADGQLYVNLRGFGPSAAPVSAGVALHGFLDALGVPPARMPAELDERAALYRSLLAGRRMLIVADNARDAAQVRPLLPGTPGSLVLVTSRSRLTGLAAAEGARLIDLDVLTEQEARDLLAARIGADRITVEPGVVTRIIATCGRLPLALAIVAARASAHAALCTVADELQASRLDALASEDPATDVRTVFSWSHRAASPQAARLFRLMAVHPGPSISLPAAASLAGLPSHQARLLLAELAAARLIEVCGPNRFALHDLLRAYADGHNRDLDRLGEQEAAAGRILSHYQHTAYAAVRLIDPSRETVAPDPPQTGVTPEELSGYQQALDWFTVERAVLVAAVQQAAARGNDRPAWQLAWTLWPFLFRAAHWEDQAIIGEAAVTATQRLADVRVQAGAHRILGDARIELRHWEQATTHITHALDLCRQAADQAGQGKAHHSLTLICGRQGRYAEALGHAREALALHQAAGNSRGQANALNCLGWYHIQAGDHHAAVTACQQALGVFQAAGLRHGEGATWDSLGLARHHLAQYDQAIDCYEHALALFRELGEARYAAGVLTRLGDAHLAAGQPDAARTAWQQALVILEEYHQPEADQLRVRLR